ncbi:MAG: tetratricopeptide repeat protein [Neisseriaceae bacterium]|nr:MAG: tetratricopeptide repeat protein [Neisseriaceae bacterium]
MSKKELFLKSCNLLFPYLSKKENIDLTMMEKDLLESMNGFKSIIEKFPKSGLTADCHWMIGKIFDLKNNNEESYNSFILAKNIYAKLFIAKKISSRVFSDSMREISLQCLKTKRYDEAVYFANTALEFSPKDYTLLSNLSVTKLFQGRLDEAKKIAIKCQKKFPEDFPSKTVLFAVKQIKNKVCDVPKTFKDFGNLIENGDLKND